MIEREAKAEQSRKRRFERKVELAAIEESEILRETLNLKQMEKVRDQLRSKSREKFY